MKYQQIRINNSESPENPVKTLKKLSEVLKFHIKYLQILVDHLKIVKYWPILVKF